MIIRVKNKLLAGVNNQCGINSGYFFYLSSFLNVLIYKIM